jgi:hypothetical protein
MLECIILVDCFILKYLYAPAVQIVHLCSTYTGRSVTSTLLPVVDGLEQFCGTSLSEVMELGNVSTYLQRRPTQFFNQHFYTGFHEVYKINALYLHIKPLKLMNDFSDTDTAVFNQVSEACLIFPS